jgi:hypothetical protein
VLFSFRIFPLSASGSNTLRGSEQRVREREKGAVVSESTLRARFPPTRTTLSIFFRAKIDDRRARRMDLRRPVGPRKFLIPLDRIPTAPDYIRIHLEN